MNFGYLFEFDAELRLGFLAAGDVADGSDSVPDSWMLLSGHQPLLCTV